MCVCVCVCVCVYTQCITKVSTPFSRYLSISLHETTLTKGYFDTTKSSLYAAYIIELIYFTL